MGKEQMVLVSFEQMSSFFFVVFFSYKTILVGTHWNCLNDQGVHCLPPTQQFSEIFKNSTVELFKV